MDISISQEDVERAGHHLLEQLREHGQFDYGQLLDDAAEVARLESALKITHGKTVGAFSAAMHHLTYDDICEICEYADGRVLVIKLDKEIPGWFEFQSAPNHSPLTRSNNWPT